MIISKTVVLIIDSERYILSELSYLLYNEGYSVNTCDVWSKALLKLSEQQVDLIIADPANSDFTGVEVVRKLREHSSSPIIITSAIHDQEYVAEVLDAGADDFIKKPFGFIEFLARIRTTLRHFNSRIIFEKAPKTSYTVGNLTINFSERQVCVDGKLVHFTPIEYGIVELLAENRGKIVTYEDITRRIWGYYYDDSNKTLRVNMANIRRKLEISGCHCKYIFTETGIGYRFATNEDVNHKQQST